MIKLCFDSSWWCHQMETFPALLPICVVNSPVTGEFPAQRPETRSFDVSFDLRPNKRWSTHWWDWWFETSLRPLWCQCNVNDSCDANKALMLRTLVVKEIILYQTRYISQLDVLTRFQIRRPIHDAKHIHTRNYSLGNWLIGNNGVVQ